MSCRKDLDLWAAAQKGILAEVSRLVKREGCNVNYVNAANNTERRSALHAAVYSGHLGTARCEGILV